MSINWYPSMMAHGVSNLFEGDGRIVPAHGADVEAHRIEVDRERPMTMAVQGPGTMMTAIPDSQGIMEEDELVSLRGEFMIGRDLGPPFGLGDTAFVVVAGDQDLGAMELSKERVDITGLSVPGDISQVKHDIPGRDAFVPIGDEAVVMLFDRAERTMIVNQDVGVSEMCIGGEPVGHGYYASRSSPCAVSQASARTPASPAFGSRCAGTRRSQKMWFLGVYRLTIRVSALTERRRVPDGGG